MTIMRVSVNFHQAMPQDSVVWSNLKAVALQYPNRYWIGVDMGFCVANLSWKQAYALATKILYVIAKSESWDVFSALRLDVQPDPERR